MPPAVDSMRASEEPSAFPVRIAPTKHWSDHLKFCRLNDLFCLTIYLPDESDRTALTHWIAHPNEEEVALGLKLRDETHLVSFPPRVLSALLARIDGETGVCFLVPQDYTFANCGTERMPLESYDATERSMSCAWLDSQDDLPQHTPFHDGAPIGVIDTQEPLVDAVPTNATFGYREMCNPMQIPDLDRTARIPELGFPNWIVHHVRQNKAAYEKAVKNRTAFTTWVVKQYVQENRLLDPDEIRTLIHTIEAIYQGNAETFAQDLWAGQGRPVPSKAKGASTDATPT